MFITNPHDINYTRPRGTKLPVLWNLPPNPTGPEMEPTKEGEVQGTREGNTALALGIASEGVSLTGRQINVAD